MSPGPLHYSSISDLLKQRRAEMNISLRRLAVLSQIDKGHISKIENGEVKQPEFATVYRITSAMGISFEETVEHYIEASSRSDELIRILEEAITKSNTKLLAKISNKYLQSTQEDSYEAVEKLYNITMNQDSPTTKLALYKVIKNYSRDHGVMPYLAKGMYQEYLIERDDFTRLKKTYEMGRRILQFTQFLSESESVTFYYKLGVHAYNLRLFEDSIELCSKVLDQEPSLSKIKVDSTGIIVDSHDHLGNYDSCNAYLEQYSKYTAAFPYVQNHVEVTTASLYTRKGDTQAAISILEKCLENCNDNSLLHVVNKLVGLHLRSEDLSRINELLKLEEKILAITYRTPYKQIELAHFYKLKGQYNIIVGDIIHGVNCFIESGTRYAKVNDYENERHCLSLVLDLHIKHGALLGNTALEMLRNLFNIKEESLT
ncbi:helix-turn-helix domain-containing protein [Paenibacillus sp. 481]|uniref:helix-turn-helix domain-containing protein n=1 Tax=Paenibacillus sp. 481 TaxID=2835869 RepID=UPI001E330D91|nr:helix-turn-helix domain-containing protein [Paenibacillus sp. 481]UHA74990.1 helix-turn-helix transcriptional regulator [Paenibacillus sp. 481]